MGVTRQAVGHLYDECIECKYRKDYACIYAKRADGKCVWYRKKRIGYKLVEPRLINCPIKADKGDE